MESTTGYTFTQFVRFFLLQSDSSSSSLELYPLGSILKGGEGSGVACPSSAVGGSQD